MMFRSASQESPLLVTDPQRYFRINCSTFNGYFSRANSITLLSSLLIVGGLLSLRPWEYDCRYETNSVACSNIIEMLYTFNNPEPDESLFYEDNQSAYFLPLSQRKAMDVNVFQLDPWKLQATENVTFNKDEKLIVVWGDFGNQFVGRDRELFDGCPVKTCFITMNKSYAAQSSAVLFYAGYMSNPKGKTLSALPKKQDKQVFVYVQGESPVNSNGNGAMSTAHFFNWTMTYRLDSDVRGHYTYKVPLQRKKRNFAKGKDKLVVWFNSHCNVASGRDEYVRKLQQYIPVDIYGKCGNLTCEKAAQDTMPKKCLDVIRRHKFYVAFENSICQDYVTEKTVTALENGVIPVVLGDGNYSIFPPNSYIHVFNFTGPFSLAKYLHYLDKNDTAYNEYMAWRYKPHLVQSHDGNALERSGYCQLCKKLHEMDRGSYQSESIENIDHWWRGREKSVCVKDWKRRAKHRSRATTVNYLINPEK